MGARGGGGDGGSRPRSTPRIVVVDADPQFTLLLREQFPRAAIVLVQPEDDLNGLLREGPDLAVVDLSGPRVDQVLLHADVLPVIGVGPRPLAEPPVEGLRAVVVRPYDASMLRWTVERVLQPPRPAERLQRWRPNTTWLLPLAELAALAIALPELMGGGVLLAGAFAVAVVAALAPFERPAGHVVATVSAATMILLVGDPTSSVVPYALVVAARAGVEGGVRSGSGAGLALAVAATPGIVATSRGAFDLAMVMATMLVYPAIALATAQTVRVRTGHARPREEARELHRALRRVHRAMEEVPGQASPPRVAHQLAGEVLARAHADAVVVLVGHTVLQVLADIGIRERLDLRLVSGTPGLVTLERGWTPGSALRPELAALDSRLAWRAVPLAHGGQRVGMLLVGRRLGRPRGGMLRLHRATRTGALALLNALHLQRLQHLGIEAERLQLARDIEEQVAQPLAHVRFELASLAQERDQSSCAGAALRDVEGVTRRAMVDATMMLAELVAPSVSVGITAALREFVRDLVDADGAPVQITGDLGPRTDPLLEQELFGIATEAIGRVLLLHGVRRVRVELARHGGQLRVVVGHEIDEQDALGGWDDVGGRPSMRERSDRVGAHVRETVVGRRRALELVWGDPAVAYTAVRP